LERPHATRSSILLGLLVSVVLILSHLLGLPGYPTRGWLFSPRVQKTAAFSIEDVPFDHESWTSRWGRNRPPTGRTHAILSEVEVRVKYESRSNHVVLTVTADSEEEVDAFIQTIKADLARTVSIDPPPHSRAHSDGATDESSTTIYWRQRYLCLLIMNTLVFVLLWFALRRRKSKSVEAVPPNT
jgi:hypothetical protein